MNVKDIVKAFLDAVECDGLCNSMEACGCGKDDLFCCCAEPGEDCVPATRRAATKEEAEEAECNEGDDLYFPADLLPVPTFFRHQVLMLIQRSLENGCLTISAGALK